MLRRMARLPEHRPQIVARAAGAPRRVHDRAATQFYTCGSRRRAYPAFKASGGNHEHGDADG
jgi:hypothetical protein